MNAIQCAVDIKTNQLPDVISAIHPWQVVQKIKKREMLTTFELTAAKKVTAVGKLPSKFCRLITNTFWNLLCILIQCTTQR